MEVLLKEGSGSDHVSVGMQLPSASTINLIEKKYLYTERPVVTVLPEKFILPVKPVLPPPSLPGMYGNTTLCTLRQFKK
jgi:hypothetical protein